MTVWTTDARTRDRRLNASGRWRPRCVPGRRRRRWPAHSTCSPTCRTVSRTRSPAVHAVGPVCLPAATRGVVRCWRTCTRVATFRASIAAHAMRARACPMCSRRTARRRAIERQLGAKRLFDPVQAGACRVAGRVLAVTAGRARQLERSASRHGGFTWSAIPSTSTNSELLAPRDAFRERPALATDTSDPLPRQVDAAQARGRVRSRPSPPSPSPGRRARASPATTWGPGARFAAGSRAAGCASASALPGCSRAGPARRARRRRRRRATRRPTRSSASCRSRRCSAARRSSSQTTRAAPRVIRETSAAASRCRSATRARSAAIRQVLASQAWLVGRRARTQRHVRSAGDSRARRCNSYSESMAASSTVQMPASASSCPSRNGAPWLRARSRGAARAVSPAPKSSSSTTAAPTHRWRSSGACWRWRCPRVTARSRGRGAAAALNLGVAPASVRARRAGGPGRESLRGWLPRRCWRGLGEPDVARRAGRATCPTRARRLSRA